MKNILASAAADQRAADRLDLVRILVLVDEGDYVRDRRWSSAITKQALALPRISSDFRYSRTSRSSAVPLALIEIASPALPQRRGHRA